MAVYHFNLNNRINLDHIKDSIKHSFSSAKNAVTNSLENMKKKKKELQEKCECCLQEKEKEDTLVTAQFKQIGASLEAVEGICKMLMLPLFILSFVFPPFSALFVLNFLCLKCIGEAWKDDFKDAGDLGVLESKGPSEKTLLAQAKEREKALADEATAEKEAIANTTSTENIHGSEEPTQPEQAEPVEQESRDPQPTQKTASHGGEEQSM